MPHIPRNYGGGMLHKGDRIADWVAVVKRLKKNDQLKAKVLEDTEKGMVVDVGVPVFLPHWKLGPRPLTPDERAALIGKTIDVIVTNVNVRHCTIRLSHRLIFKLEESKGKTARLESLIAGNIYSGVVANFQNYGVFVDIGDHLQGLLHNSQTGFARLHHPKEIFKIGQVIAVKILAIDPERERVKLALVLSEADRKALETRLAEKSAITSGSIAVASSEPAPKELGFQVPEMRNSDAAD